ncbi:MAG: hypothetical protein ACIRZH_08285, partial [Ligilactobacillus ruminis]
MSTWLSFFINLHHYTGITTESLPLTYQALHLAKSLPVTDTLSKMQDLSVNLNEILNKLVDQHRFKKDSA